MRFEGVVWRYVPASASPFHVHYLIHAAGRWNRRGVYGCLYTALTAEGAAAELQKHVVRRGFDEPCDLVSFTVRIEHVFDLAGIVGFPDALQTRAAEPHGSGVRWSETGAVTRSLHLDPHLGTIELSALVGNSEPDLDACRTLADRLRASGHLGILAPSAAAAGEIILAIYPENRPEELSYGPHVLQRFALNYGPERILDPAGRLRKLPTSA